MPLPPLPSARIDADIPGVDAPATAAALAHLARAEAALHRGRVVRTLAMPLLLAAVVTAGAPGLYRVQPGDTASEIALRYGTSTAALVQANHLRGNGNLIYAGTTLRIPGGGSSSSGSSAGRSSTSSGGGATGSYRVGVGDTLSGVGARFGVDWRTIARQNHIGRPYLIRIGQTLRVPGAGGTSGSPSFTQAERTFAGRTYALRTVSSAAINRRALARTGVPSRDATRDLIIDTSHAYGVDANLALAVAWMESGWSQRSVSVANAIGVMQLLPSTGEWMSTIVGRDLNIMLAKDNVVGGVVLLKVLRGMTSNDWHAVAGYYQGVASVREHGMFRDTRRYVHTIMALRTRFARG